MDGYTLTAKLKKQRRRLRLTATEQALFHELVSICNEDGWTDVFCVSNEELYLALNISENTLVLSRQSLINAKLIFYQSGKSKRQVGKYSFTKQFKTTSKSEVDADTNTEVDVDTNADTNAADYNKTKTKTKEENILKEKSDFDKFNDWMDSNCPRVRQMKNQMTEQSFDKLKSKYDSFKLIEILENMENHKPLLKKYVDVYKTLNNWLKIHYGNDNTSA